MRKNLVTDLIYNAKLITLHDSFIECADILGQTKIQDQRVLAVFLAKKI